MFQRPLKFSKGKKGQQGRKELKQVPLVEVYQGLLYDAGLEDLNKAEIAKQLKEDLAVFTKQKTCQVGGKQEEKKKKKKAPKVAAAAGLSSEDEDSSSKEEVPKQLEKKGTIKKRKEPDKEEDEDEERPQKRARVCQGRGREAHTQLTTFSQVEKEVLELQLEVKQLKAALQEEQATSRQQQEELKKAQQALHKVEMELASAKATITCLQQVQQDYCALLFKGIPQETPRETRGAKRVHLSEVQNKCKKPLRWG